MTRGELVAQLRNAHVAHHRLDQEVLVVRRCDQHLVDVAAALLVLDRRGACRYDSLSPSNPTVVADEVARVDGHVLVYHNVAGLDVSEETRRYLHVHAHLHDAVVAERLVVLEESRPGGVVHSLLLFATRGSANGVLRSVGILLEREDLLLADHHASVASVDGGLVEHDGVLDIVAGVGHDGDHGILTGGQLGEVEQVEDTRAHHRHHGVHEEVERRDVHALLLVAGDGSNGLLSHGALVGVSRRLVVVGIRDQRRDDAEDRHRVDFHVCVRGRDVPVADGDETRVLLVHVNVLDDSLNATLSPSLPRERARRCRACRVAAPRRASASGRVVRSPCSGRAAVCRCGRHRTRGGRSDGSACHLHRAAHLVVVDADELSQESSPPQLADGVDEGVRLRVDAEDATVQEDDVAGVRVELLGADEADVEHAEVVGDLTQRLFVLVGGDVREDGERLDQTALLSFGRVAGTHHAELRRLQGSRSADLLRLLHVRANARHVADGGDVGETRDGLR